MEKINIKGEKMTWGKYRDLYYNYELSAIQGFQLTLMGEKYADMLKAIEEAMPQQDYEGLILDLDGATATLTEIYKNGDFPGKLKPKVGQIVNGCPSVSLLVIYSKLRIMQGIMKISPSREHLANVLYGRELVMLFALLDAFMDDSLEMICKRNPKIMIHKDEIMIGNKNPQNRGSKEKTLTWAQIISCDKWDYVINLMIKKFIKGFSYNNPLKNRIKFLNSNVNLEIKLGSEDKKFFEKSEHIRHCIVHNSGKADDLFIKRYNETKINIADYIPITTELIYKIFHKTRIIANEIFASASKKYFGKTDSDLKNCWGRAQVDIVKKAPQPK